MTEGLGFLVLEEWNTDTNSNSVFQHSWAGMPRGMQQF